MQPATMYQKPRPCIRVPEPKAHERPAQEKQRRQRPSHWLIAPAAPASPPAA